MTEQRQYFRVRQRSKRRYVTNQTSGHSWPEETLLELYDVVGYSGLAGTFKTYERAKQEADELNAYHNKYPSPFLHDKPNP